jgi:hypothetical protein
MLRLEGNRVKKTCFECVGNFTCNFSCQDSERKGEKSCYCPVCLERAVDSLMNMQRFVTSWSRIKCDAISEELRSKITLVRLMQELKGR